MQNKILNIKTGRYVRKNGQTGKKIIEEAKMNSMNAVLVHKNVRVLVKRFLVFENLIDYINERKRVYRHIFTKTKHLGKFYRHSLFYFNLINSISFAEIQYYYFTYIKLNLRYNLFNNSEELIKDKIVFCRRMNRILKQRNIIYRLPCFKKYIIALENSIRYESRTHGKNLKTYKRDLLMNCFNRPLVKYITYYW